MFVSYHKNYPDKTSSEKTQSFILISRILNHRQPARNNIPFCVAVMNASVILVLISGVVVWAALSQISIAC